MNARTENGRRMLYCSALLSSSICVTLTSGMASCTRCTMFCRRTLSDSGTLHRVCSGIVRRMTCAMACPRVSFDAMPCVALSFNVWCAENIFQSLWS